MTLTKLFVPVPKRVPFCRDVPLDNYYIDGMHPATTKNHRCGQHEDSVQYLMMMRLQGVAKNHRDMPVLISGYIAMLTAKARR